MWHPECVRIDSPNFGYGRGTHGQLRGNIQSSRGGGAFYHSVVGSWQAARDRFLNPAESASAHFIIRKVGVPVQMVDSADCAWHAGGQIHNDPLPGGPVIGDWANLFFHGFEFEGGPPGNFSEPLTGNQVNWGVKLTHWLEEIGEGRSGIYVLRETLWEHNWVYPTACPSGRIPWPTVIAQLEATMEDDMLTQEEHEWLETARNSSVNVDLETDTMIQQWPALKADVAAIKTKLDSPAGTLTPAQIEAIATAVANKLSQRLGS